jgi:hypothetical protein
VPQRLAIERSQPTRQPIGRSQGILARSFEKKQGGFS